MGKQGDLFNGKGKSLKHGQSPWPKVAKDARKGKPKPTPRRLKQTTEAAKVAHLNRKDWL
jgi:hypothetical protein